VEQFKTFAAVSEVKLRGEVSTSDPDRSRVEVEAPSLRSHVSGPKKVVRPE
jgi:hypothetical protein